jgi:hypothetical protein
MPAAGLLVLAGAVACFAGYRLFRIVLAVFGFLLGVYIATSVVGEASTLTLLAVALLGGVIGAAVMALAYFLGVALVGSAIGVVIAHAAFAALGREPGPLAVVLVAMAGAIASVYVERYVVMVGTAFGGAWTLLLGLISAVAGAPAAAQDLWVLYPLDPVPGRGWLVPVWLVLGMAGLAVQSRWTAGSNGRVGRRRT